MLPPHEPRPPSLGPTSTEAHRAYQDAQAAVCAGRDPRGDLERALALDPTLAVAAADLAALDGRTLPPAGAHTGWERQHLEIVATVIRDVARAEALLREHASHQGCDPIALHLVAQRIGALDCERLSDLRTTACTCVPPFVPGPPGP